MIPGCRAKRALPWAILLRALGAWTRRAARGKYDGVKAAAVQSAEGAECNSLGQRPRTPR